MNDDEKREERPAEGGSAEGSGTESPLPDDERHDNTAEQAEDGKAEQPENESAGGRPDSGQPQYKNPGSPYGYYGQYGAGQPQDSNAYGQYGAGQPQDSNAYGQYGAGQPQDSNAYGQYGGGNNNYWRNGSGGPYAPYGQNNSTGPYMPYGTQYGGPYGQKPVRPPKSRGLKIFLFILLLLSAGLVGGLVTYSIGNMPKVQSGSAGQSSSAGSSTSSGSAQAGSGSSSSAAGGVKNSGISPNFPGIAIQTELSGTHMDAAATYKKVVPSVVSVEVDISGSSSEESGTSEGTGIIASSGGYILTNAHVVNYSKGNTVKVTLHSGKTYPAVVAGYDKTSDIAVLKINASGLSPAVFGNVDNMQIGDSVIAIGSPGGISFAGSLTGGYISALNRVIEANSGNGMTYIQTDAAINPGNSGGPLVNMYGQVIGINSNKVVAKGYESMGFSIPVSRARTIINDLIQKGYVAGRCRLGVTVGSVPEIYREYYNYPEGVLIQTVGSDSDLKNKGITAGDIITKAGGNDIKSIDDLYSMLNAHKPGDEISITVYSTAQADKGKTKTVKVKLLEDKGETQN